MTKPPYVATFASVASLVVFASLARDAARMELPADLATRTERLEATGFGGANRGRYSLGVFTGEFTRIESRFALFDPLYAASSAKSSFTVVGPEVDTPFSAECGMRETTVTLGVITFDPSKMTYQCSFQQSSTALSDASLVLGEPKPEGMRARLLAKAERRGEAAILGQRIGIQSVHKFAGSKLQSPTPVGYLLLHEDSAVGAIEVTDVNPTILLPTNAAPELRQSVLLTALALAVLRDPENSALGD